MGQHLAGKCQLLRWMTTTTVRGRFIMTTTAHFIMTTILFELWVWLSLPFSSSWESSLPSKALICHLTKFSPQSHLLKSKVPLQRRPEVEHLFPPDEESSPGTLTVSCRMANICKETCFFRVFVIFFVSRKPPFHTNRRCHLCS
ncbi:hypothetical protein P4O66_010619 [Electrophorus voltai]|uniref:Uncharacterized protein n=1 Tax=Electrophorus voltai TaxID=2609070 RepID=A0AAD8ZCE2_9TELE|nr:hypothetical protein P4O66_010619 [Electrophorus voltai]